MGISLGILGAGGSFVQAFIPLFRDHPLVDRLILCDHDPQKLVESAARNGIPDTVDSFDRLLDSDVDAIAIFTQHWMHAPQAVRALEAGKHVYSAVPAAADLDEMTALVRAVERTGLIYQMGETSAYYDDAIWCRERFRAGDFGAIAYCEGEYIHDWDHGLYEVSSRRYGPGWRAKSGTPPMHYPTHSIGMVLSVTGAHATHVSCVGVRDTRAEDADIYTVENAWGNQFSNQTALFRMSDGSAMRINEMRRVGHPSFERMSIYGSEHCFARTSAGALWMGRHDATRALDDEFSAGSAGQVRRRSRLPESLRVSDRGHGGAHAFLADDFVKACAWSLTPRVNVWQAARYLVPGLIAHRSALSGGEQIAIPDFGPGPEVDHLGFETAVASAQMAR